MKNDVINLEITDITPDGFGVGRHEGMVCFVADTAVGDNISALVLKELKNRSFAKIIEIKNPSRHRIPSECQISHKCGGCAFRHISYEAELNLKRNFVSQAFNRIGGLNLKINETIFSDEKNYRNKVQYPFGRNEKGQCIFGYYARRSHRIIEHSECLLQDDIFSEIAQYCAQTANQLFLRAYDESSGKGILRHIVMRKNRQGKILVCLVVNENHKKLELLGKELTQKFPEIIGIHINVNKRRDNVIFGEETFCLTGKEALTDILCGKTFEISPRAFYQVNAEMAEKLYMHGKSLIHPEKEGRIILDLYCGAGTIGICVAEENDKLCGVEIIPDAVENAKKNANLNGRTEDNTLFVCGDASVGVGECIKKFGKPHVIIVDPPRKGLEKAVIETVVSANPNQVLYISCDPATLARDCAIFAEKGYTATEATPFDLFPRTGHVETVVCLSKQ